MEKISLIKTLVYNCFYYTQFYRFFRFFNRNKLTLLMYHGFTNESLGRFFELSDGKHVKLDNFKFQLKYLKKNYCFLTLEKFLEYKRFGKKLPKHPLIITIDDGYKSNFKLAYPLLKKMKIPATIFLTTDFVENKNFLLTDKIEYSLAMAKPRIYYNKIFDEGQVFRINSENKKTYLRKFKLFLKSIPRELQLNFVNKLESLFNFKLHFGKDILEIYQPLDWSDIKLMLKSGLISFGSHTHTHSILSLCSSNELDHELVTSKNLVEKRLNLDCNLFSYPNGTAKDFNEVVIKKLKSLGYSCALTTIPGFNDIASDVYQLKRIAIDSRMNKQEFIMNLVGFRYLLSKLFHIFSLKRENNTFRNF